jgi:hypothetical protein
VKAKGKTKSQTEAREPLGSTPLDAALWQLADVLVEIALNPGESKTDRSNDGQKPTVVEGEVEPNLPENEANHQEWKSPD